MMSVKKQLQSLCKLCSFYEKLPEVFSDKTDADICFYHNVFDFSLSRHRIAGVSRGSNKKSFAVNLFKNCGLQTQQPYILQEEVNISKKELTFLVDSLRNFLELFDHASK